MRSLMSRSSDDEHCRGGPRGASLVEGLLALQQVRGLHCGCLDKFDRLPADLILASAATNTATGRLERQPARPREREMGEQLLLGGQMDGSPPPVAVWESLDVTRVQMIEMHAF